MERKYNICYYRDGLSVYTICENSIELLSRLIHLLNDISVKDIKVFEVNGLDSCIDSKLY